MTLHQTGELRRVVPAPRPPLSRKSTVVRFMEKVNVIEGGCWEWAGSLGKLGYGWFRHPETKYAHRASYLLFVGPIPEGLSIDHVCENKKCVNPDHLDPVTQDENVARAAGRWNECDRLHPDTATRLAVKKNGRKHCQECHKWREKRRRDAFRESQRKMWAGET